jgi:hypothetical protein
VEIILADNVDMDMEAPGVTIREVLYNHKDSKGAQLFESIEKTNNGGTYHVLFDKAKTVAVDAVLDNLDGSLASLGGWKNCHTHYRYHTNEEIRIFGSVPRPSATRNTSPFGPATWRSSKYKAFLWKLTPVPCSIHPKQNRHSG